jgi:ABC-2 type transport system permease protein
MNKYLTAMKAAFMEASEYRLNFLFSFLYNIIPLTATVFLWLAVYSSGASQPSIKGFTVSTMISYYVIVQWVGELTAPSVWSEIPDSIRNGTLSIHLLKPINYIFYYFCIIFANKIPYAIIGLGVTSLFTLFVRAYFFYQTDIYYLLLFFISLLLGNILAYLIGFLRILPTFWFEESSGFNKVSSFIISVATGSLIPFAFFPKAIGQMLEILPFKYLVYFPVQIYLGRISYQEILQDLLIGFFWLFFFLLLVEALWKQ